MLPASLKKRLFASMIDLTIFMALYTLIYFFISFQYFTSQSPLGRGYGYEASIPICSNYLIIWAGWMVFIILTEFRSGQSIGKRLMKIKVLSRDLKNTTIHQTFIRHVFDVVDLFLFIGLVVAKKNASRQKIGDLLAETVVVTK